MFERSCWRANRLSVTGNWPEMAWASAALGQSKVVFCCSNQTTTLMNIPLQHFISSADKGCSVHILQELFGGRKAASAA